MNKRILIIEDDIETQFLFSELLEAEGYVVATASSGKDALKMINNGTSPDLIFMDLNFPGGTPEEFTTSLREIPGSKDVPIVIISGKTEIADYATRLNAASYIKKPFDLDPLLNLIQTII